MLDPVPQINSGFRFASDPRPVPVKSSQSLPASLYGMADAWENGHGVLSVFSYDSRKEGICCEGSSKVLPLMVV